MILHTPDRLVTDADEALTMLKEGNQRYLAGKAQPKDSYAAEREVLKSGQKPFAVVLCCADSRVSPEIFFDQKLGDIFVIRNAGNIVERTVLGSIEYAVEHLHTPLVVVCGHSCCGAVTAVCQGAELSENMAAVGERIKPALDVGNDIEQVARRNVELAAANIAENAMVKHTGARVVQAFYNIHTGQVDFS